MKKAYSLLEVKSFADEGEFFEFGGIATTPDTDRQGDIVEPMGANFSTPLPLLLQHNHELPVGQVTLLEPTPAGINFKARIPYIKEAGVLKDRTDEAIQSIKHRLITGVSIGFSAIEDAVERIKTGFRFLKWNLMELSLVTIPANAGATITTVKSLCNLAPEAALQPKTARAVAPVKLSKGNKMAHAKKTVAEQLKQYAATRAEKIQQIADLQEKSLESGETFDAAQAESFDTLKSEIDAIDTHVKRLQEMERLQMSTAKSVAHEAQAAEHRSSVDIGNPVRISTASRIGKGIRFARSVQALIASRGNRFEAAMLAEKHFADTPEVATFIKASPGTTTNPVWAGNLTVPDNLASEFVELLRPETFFGRLNGFRNVPFNIRIPTQTGGSLVSWVGEAAPKPVGELAFGSQTLLFNKIAGIVVMTQELARFSDPNAEMLIRDDLIRSIAEFTDKSFIDPSLAPVAGVSPGSVTNGATNIPATGQDETAMYRDFGSLVEAFLTANLSPAGAYILMTSVQASRLSLFRTALNVPVFPDLGVTGGTLMGFPVVTSENLPTASDGTSIIVMIKPSEILLASDGNVSVDVSQEATLDMNGGTSPTTNLWQRNLVGIRAEQFITWARRRPEAVAYISGANYQPGVTPPTSSTSV